MVPQTWTEYFLSLIPSLFLIFLWLVPVLIAFSQLRKHAIDDTAKAIWVLIILILPVVGPITYLVLFRPRKKVSEK